MFGHAVYFITVISLPQVIADWVELPKVTPSKITNEHNSSTVKISLVTSSTPVLAVFTEFYNTVTSIPLQTKMTPDVDFQFANPFIKNNTRAVQKNIDDDISVIPEVNNDSYTLNDSEYVEVVNDDDDNENEDPAVIIEETLKEARRDLLEQPNRSTLGKLEYLQKIQNMLFSQIRRYSRGIWTERQARGKKLMAFASMEGALMTIAFLTFAVFLIKIVHQFIQGLQNTDPTMLLEIPSTTAPVRVTNRFKREQSRLAAAQLLQYMDDFSMKHRLHCDTP